MKPNFVCPKQGGKPEEVKSYLVSPPAEVILDAMTIRPFGFCILGVKYNLTKDVRKRYSAMNPSAPYMRSGA
jgi:hypothetical protein